MDAGQIKEQWVREKFLVLERSPQIYERLAALIKDSDEGGEVGIQFERLLSQGLNEVPRPETRRAAASFLWRQLKAAAPPAHRVQAEALIERLEEDPWAIVYLKQLFKILAAQQGWREFLDSSYLREP